MARKNKVDVEHRVLDPLADRVFPQELTYLGQDGRPITSDRMDYMNESIEVIAGILGRGVGMDMINIKGERK